MTDIITVIAYKPNGDSSCRGCVMETWDSKFDICITAYPPEAIDYIAGIMRADHDRSRGKHEFTVLINGRDDNCWDDEREQQDALRAQVLNSASCALEAYITAKEDAEEKARQEAAASKKRIEDAELLRLRDALDETRLEAMRVRLAELEAKQ